MITKLSQVLESYKTSDKTHGDIDYGPRTEGTGKSGNPFLVLNAEGTAVQNLTEPHITIWGLKKNQAITTVEFTWAGAKHVVYRLLTKAFSADHLTTADEETTVMIKALLKQFLIVSQIATFAASSTSTSSSAASSSSSSTDFKFKEEDFPALGKK